MNDCCKTQVESVRAHNKIVQEMFNEEQLRYSEALKRIKELEYEMCGAYGIIMQFIDNTVWCRDEYKVEIGMGDHIIKLGRSWYEKNSEFQNSAGVDKARQCLGEET